MSKQNKPSKYLCPKCGQRYLVQDGHRKMADGTRKQKWACITGNTTQGNREYCYTTVYPDKSVRGHAGKEIAPPKKFDRKLDSRYYFITTAQNATPVHSGFFYGSLPNLLKQYDAELVVIAARYKNATSVWTESQRNEEYWKVPEKYLLNVRKRLNKNLILVGDIKIQPTAVDPLTGLESVTHGESGIFGHTKLRMQCIATPQHKLPKILTTTGACTVENYTDSKAGKKGEFHHVLGGILVEVVSDKKFHLHHINARDDGSFIFGTKVYYANGRVEAAPPYKAIAFGDAHYRFADPAVVQATFGPGGLVATLKPEVLIWHDLLDCYFGNPHHQGNPFIKKAKHEARYHVAEDEVRETIRWQAALGRGYKNYIVPSNHDDMLARWIIRADWKDLPPENMEFYLETALVMARSTKMTETGAEYIDPFGHWVKLWKPVYSDTTPLKINQSLMIGDIECGFHGDKGPRGARGTIKNFGSIGVKAVTGHGHSPAIWQGHYRLGTMTHLTAEYVFGPNDWLNTHISIDGFNKRHLHTCIDGSFGI